MGLFKKPLVEVREIKVGDEVILLSPPTALNYREYIRRLKAIYEEETTVDELNDVDLSTESETTPEIVSKLHRLQDQQERAIMLQIVCCAIENLPGSTWDELLEELRSNAHRILFDAVDSTLVEFLNLGNDSEATEAEKKPGIQTQDSPTD